MRRTLAGEILSIAAAAGAGAGLMYFLDPNKGKRRRVLVADQARHLQKVAGDSGKRAVSDLKNRAKGIAAEAKRLFSNKEVPDDRILEARVRSQLGRVVSHPGAIEVSGNSGTVLLTGVVLESELPVLLKCVQKVPGVSHVEDRLARYEDDAEMPARPHGAGGSLSPGTRLFLGGIGLGLLTLATRVGRLKGSIPALIGLGMLVRASTNCPLKAMMPPFREDLNEWNEDLEASISRDFIGTGTRVSA